MKLNKYIILVLCGGIFSGCRVMDPTDSILKQEPITINRNDSTVIVAASEVYRAESMKRTLLGDHYRDVWAAPVEVPIVNLDKELGGLEILEKGGGMQTKSLKLKSKDGKLYSFRSIQKDPTNILPDILQSTIAADIMQDQISASHPYGAFILPGLGEAAGIYHTNPKLFYIPDVPELGEYREEFGGMLVMLEEDADEDWSDYEDFGFTKNAVSSETVMEDLEEDNDNEIDERALLRARLFDIWIGDWDRHEGQWRWGEFEKEDGKGIIFKPIPEDRDNAFFKFDGAIPWIASRKWALRKFQSFEEEIRDMAGLNYNARHFDRRFLTEMDREDWIAEADSLQRRLTDEIIDKAVRQWPDTIYALTGEEFSHKLKVRRDKLKESAERYYEILAKNVDIVGSDKHEFFVVDRQDDDHTKVTVYKSNDEGEKEKVLYERTFLNEETDEVRLYGFGNEDFFEVNGRVKKGIVVRIIGGDDPDKIVDKSRVNGLNNKTKIYDLRKDTEIEESSETRDLTGRSLDLNRYDYASFDYNLLAPQVYFGYNVDDGVFIGGGVLIKTNNFRKYDFSTSQRIIGNVALLTGAYNFKYEGIFREVFRTMDFIIDLQVRAPNNVSNYFGMGNKTTREVEEKRYYRYRRDEIILDPGFQLRFGRDNYIKFGPSFRYNNVREEFEGFVSTPEAGIDPEAYGKTTFGGFFVETMVSSTNEKYFPLNGVKWTTHTGWYHGLFEERNDYSTVQSDLNFYFTPYKFPLTLAARFGAASNIGDFYFFQAHTLGGNAGFNKPGNLRGYVRDRFSGKTTFYQNTELRLRLYDLKFYILPVEVGLLGFIDHGRVLSDVSDGKEWHRGYGGGLFLRPVERWVFTATYAKSKEDNLINVHMGFMF